MPVRYKLTSNAVVELKPARPGDSGVDIAVADLGDFDGRLWPGQTVVVWAGFAIELPPGSEGQVRPRSSTAKRGLLVHLGTIDSGYRGPIGMTVTNVGLEPKEIKFGDKLAQLVICPVIEVRFEEASELSSTVRGDAGYGSTGP